MSRPNPVPRSEPERLLELVAAWCGMRVLVVGDPIIDVYYFGHCVRLSPEAPVPVFVTDRIETRRGGALNVCANVEALGGIALLSAPKVGKDSPPCSVKIRFVAGTHQLLRVDSDHMQFPAESDMPSLEELDAVVISDYAKGWIESAFCHEIIERANVLGLPVVVDPKTPDWEKFRGASVICPNQLEYEAACQAGTSITPVMLKRGADGITLIRQDLLTALHVTVDFPAQARHVYDVTGAGDTVAAVAALALSAGGSLEDCCTLANLAAGQVVAELGTVPCSLKALKSCLDA